MPPYIQNLSNNQYKKLTCTGALHSPTPAFRMSKETRATIEK